MTDLEKEMQELDIWIELNVFKTRAEKLCHDKQNNPIPTRNWSSDPAAALMVLEKCIENCSTVKITGPKFTVSKKYYVSNLDDDLYVSVETLPLATALFAKKLFS